MKVVQREEQPTVGLRETVPMAGLTDFFGRAFSQTMTALQAAGARPVGPPFGKYYGTPSDVVDVEAGFPVATIPAVSGAVVAGSLPGGRVVEAVHVGPYDTMEKTYAEMTDFMSAEGLTPAGVMWETYLSDPDAEPDPSTWRTLICWPLA